MRYRLHRMKKELAELADEMHKAATASAAVDTVQISCSWLELMAARVDKAAQLFSELEAGTAQLHK